MDDVVDFDPVSLFTESLDSVDVVFSEALVLLSSEAALVSLELSTGALGLP
ncbi:MAG: hypothetical protein MK034_01885 [Dehalococcoidia bacterium]|nr:hypothetical protein [Dehalococcoidia bacterium]